MKKTAYQICLIFLISLIGVIPKISWAVDSSPSAKTKELVDKVTKIAESTVTKRTYSGTIKSVGTTSIVITTPDGDRTVTTNDVTTFFRIRAGNRTEINFKALKVSDDLVVLGNIDPQTKEMAARQIIAKIKRQNLVGTLDSLGKVDLSDAVLKKISGSKAAAGRPEQSRGIATAKLADFTKDSLVFAIVYSPDPTSATLSALKAVVYLPQ